MKAIETAQNISRANLRRELPATTVLAGLASSLTSWALAQDAQLAVAGAPVSLPTIDVNAVGGGEGGYTTPSVLQSTTKLAVPTFDQPVSVQTVPRQVLIDQNALTISEALANVSSVHAGNNNISEPIQELLGSDESVVIPL